MNTNILINLLPLATITLINAYWTWQNRRVQNDRDIIKSLQAQIKQKDDILASMVNKKSQLKIQYQNLLNENHKLVGQLKTYQEFHKHNN